MAEIGLSQATVIKQLEVKWPHHTKQKSIFKNIAVNQIIKIVEGGESYNNSIYLNSHFRKRRLNININLSF